MSSAQAQIKIQDAGQFAIDVNSFTDVGELSGITYVGPIAGEKDTFLFYVVSDNGTGEGNTPRYYDIKVRFDLNTGKVMSAKVSGINKLPVGYDLEGIAYNVKNKSVYISDENKISSQIREFRISDNSLLRTLAIPSVFKNARDNYGFEALSLQNNGSTLWTANEEALPSDGKLSSSSTGTLIRLLKYDSKLNPTSQWAYQTDPKEDNAIMPKVTRSGVSDLCVLPDGTLLTLERCLGYNFRTRIYEVDFNNATNVSAFPSISADYIKKTGKSLLFEKVYDVGDTARNYEGICLGPKLTNGSYALLLIADHDVSKAQYIYALTISGIKETPITPNYKSLLFVPPLAAGLIFLKRKTNCK